MTDRPDQKGYNLDSFKNEFNQAWVSNQDMIRGIFSDDSKTEHDGTGLLSYYLGGGGRRIKSSWWSQALY